MVGDIAEQPAAQRAHQEGRSEQHGGIELLHHRIAVWEEGRSEVQCERRIGVKVVPLDEIADRTDEDRLHPALDVMDIEMVVGAQTYSLFGHVCSPKRLLFSTRIIAAGEPFTSAQIADFPFEFSRAPIAVRLWARSAWCRARREYLPMPSRRRARVPRRAAPPPFAVRPAGPMR